MRPRPSPALIALRKAEIAARYAKKAKGRRGKPRTMAAFRISELTRLYEDRWGRRLPECDASVMAIRIMAHHLGALPDCGRRIAFWIADYASWMRLAERERLISEVSECRLRWTADKLGWKLRLSDAERQRLRLFTIGAFDVSKVERAIRRKAAKREYQRIRRRDRRAEPRAEYLARIANRAKPWLAIGISRATWYRERQRRP